MSSDNRTPGVEPHGNARAVFVNETPRAEGYEPDSSSAAVGAPPPARPRDDGRGGVKVWVVLPTYNEAENLPAMLRSLLALDLDVLVVDDDSPDGTGRLAESTAAEHARLHVLRRVGERGLGTAYLAGFRRALAAGADAVLTMDCDFSHDPGAIPALVAALDSADLVIGSRYVAGGRIDNWPASRKVLSACANWFARGLLGVPARDCTSGFRLYRGSVLAAIPWERLHSTGYSFLVESLHWAARQEGVRVSEVPIRFVDRERGQTKMGAREALDGAGNLLRLKAELLTGKTRPRSGGR